MGDNTYGELGIENASSLETPTKIPFFANSGSKVIKVQAGARHSFVLNDKGDLYSFGDNSEGQCSGLNSRMSAPTRVNLDSKERVVDVFAGYNHSFVISEGGSIYSFGDTANGKLGYPDTNLSNFKPRLIQLLKGKYANVISLGSQFSVVSTSSQKNSLLALGTSSIVP